MASIDSLNTRRELVVGDKTFEGENLPGVMGAVDALRKGK